jgi:DNA-binding MarR family transcriptional regulator
MADGVVATGGDRFDDAVELLRRYSVEMTATLDRALHTDFIKNREIRVAMRIFDRGGSELRALMEVSGLARSQVAHLLDHLVAVGFVDRVGDPLDGRAVVARLNARGRRARLSLGHDLEALLVSSRPIAKELTDLLEPVATDRGIPAPVDGGDVGSAFAVIDSVAAVGIELDHAIQARVADSRHLDGRRHLALVTLAREGTVRPGRLADELGLTSGGLTYLVDRLVSSGAVERRSGGAGGDRRGVTITITDHGRALVGATAAGVSDVAGPLHAVFARVLRWEPPEP